MKRAHFIFCKYRLTLVNIWKILNPYLGPSLSRRMRIHIYHFSLPPILKRNLFRMKLNESNPKPIKSPRALSCVATLSDFLVCIAGVFKKVHANQHSYAPLYFVNPLIPQCCTLD